MHQQSVHAVMEEGIELSLAPGQLGGRGERVHRQRFIVWIGDVLVHQRQLSLEAERRTASKQECYEQSLHIHYIYIIYGKYRESFG